MTGVGETSAPARGHESLCEANPSPPSRPSAGSNNSDAAAAELGDAAEIRVIGTVQGVGFRPTVWRLATEERLVGEVLNDSEGVLIRTGGAAESIARFLRRLSAEAPPLARIERIEARGLPAPLLAESFEIVASLAGAPRTRVAADAAVCGACRAEVLDPSERRHNYAFANCTHCGPRFSIVTAVPYDRPHTTMSAFPMCAGCREEYEQPADRRFHAQAIACAECGPQIWLERFGEQRDPVRDPDAALAQTVAALRAGKIVAIRGLGGFHLACDATDGAAIQRLRERKRRDAKPLAVMATDVEMVRRYCRITELEQRLFEAVEAPIVILAADGPEALPAELAPGLDALGFMQPYTPLHLLVLRAVGRPLVMTSGNLAHEPQVTELDGARTELRDIADLALMHDREIANRIDDSVVRVSAGQPRLLRRARGYAPGAIRLPPGFEQAPPILAYGAEQKAAFCVLAEGAAVLSQHQGDLEELCTYEDYCKNLGLYADIYDHRPQLLVADLHPEYLSTKLALEVAAERGLPLRRVQHHHAHIAGCMAERGLALHAPAVLGVALDGLGFGTDGTIWGGEFLLADYRGYQRLASLAPVAMPGGVKAVREPWRNLYAQLRAAMGWEAFTRRFGALEGCADLGHKPLAVIDRMIEAGLNTPLASSTGRLFDAVAAAVGICPDRVRYQAQAAMELEAAAARAGLPSRAEAYPFARRREAEAGELIRLDPAPMWTRLAEDLERNAGPGTIAARFHLGLAAAVAELAFDLSQGSRVDTVVLSGGCFQNKLLLEQVTRDLESRGLRCLSNVDTPANDGGVALGQAVVAAATQLSE
ncbi:Carbamoyltransferase HypF [Enhygromyxa salina]|uniref:Carbamoyltransferase n=1 Tax=Enhygromyxa salina TaxID=215803 RepID=A0A2S9XDJ1_9BACT|nr:carbamoyltransferase HypF [Enhygromyxa salina]PRP90938.1 Carbamoyltransferase HypF [Enhygromyxa salina]